MHHDTSLPPPQPTSTNSGVSFTQVGTNWPLPTSPDEQEHQTEERNLHAIGLHVGVLLGLDFV